MLSSLIPSPWMSPKYEGSTLKPFVFRRMPTFRSRI